MVNPSALKVQNQPLFTKKATFLANLVNSHASPWELANVTFPEWTHKLTYRQFACSLDECTCTPSLYRLLACAYCTVVTVLHQCSHMIPGDECTISGAFLLTLSNQQVVYREAFLKCRLASIERSSTMSSQNEDQSNYLAELTAEKDSLSPSYGHALRLLQQGEIISICLRVCCRQS